VTLRNRAELSISQGALTNSKRPQTFIEGVYPTHASSGRGALLTCNKKRYVDYICGLGTSLLGYGNAGIAKAIYNQYLIGSTVSLSTELEIEVAEKLKGLFLFTDLWKFTKTGTEACQAALRIARSYNGRSLVLSEGYHGWSDDFVSMSPPAIGVPARDWMAQFDWELIPKAAAVIVEPVILDYGPERREFLIKLRDECTKHNTVLIFDEIITGFRFPKYSVATCFGIFPDIILLGKAMGGGLPLSAIGGRKEVMKSPDFFVSGTFFGETCSLAACKALIDIVHKDGSPFSMKNLWEKGAHFLEKFNAIDPRIQIKGYPSRGAFQGDPALKALLWQEAVKAGILFGPSWFFNFPLADFTETVTHTCRDIVGRINLGAITLQGKPPQTPFAQKVRENEGK
jgi:glutamate-1-semialdehyde 2,1-aminomutase